MSVHDTTDATDRLPGTWSIGLRRVRIELLQFARDREAAFFTMLLPVLLLVVFGSAFTGNVAPGIRFSQYFLAGMLASGIVYTSFQNLAINIPQERDDGTLKRLQGTPMPKSSYFIGKLGLVCCTLLGIAFSAVPRSGRGASALVSPVVLVLQFTSGVFFQYDELPPWMQQMSALFPLKWLCQGMRSVFLPDSFQRQELAGSWELGRTALVLALWSVTALVLALRYFRFRRRDDT